MKKRIIKAVICLLLPLIAISQAPNCKKFRDGKFKSEFPGAGTDIITRKGNMQTEILNGKYKQEFYVNWIDDCTYTLKPTKPYTPNGTKLPENALITVRITKTTANSYFQTSTANFYNKEITSEMIKVN